MNARIALLLILSLVVGMGAMAQEEKAPSATGLRIKFNGFQEINGAYVFQLFFLDKTLDQQPGLLKKGDAIPSTSYTIGDFHMQVVSRENPTTHEMEKVDASTLDLIGPNQTRVTLTYRSSTTLPQ